MDAHPIVVAGHTCLDVIPTLPPAESNLAALLMPGTLRRVGPLSVATGGAVPNTGLALHRLGTPVRLVGKVGDDLVGRAILEIIAGHSPSLTGTMVVVPGDSSSYTVILSSPGLDRAFLHYPGPNDTFCAADVPDAALSGARLFHFGYPPLMRGIYLEDGRELVALLQRARGHGLVTSLDISAPDPDSEAGHVDWHGYLSHVLPYVDLFLPGFEETLWMVDRARYADLVAQAGEAGPLTRADGKLLGELSRALLDMGAAVVGLKLGDQGMYLRTTRDPDRLSAVTEPMGLSLRRWLDRELLAPAFEARLVGTTGAGDCAVAGFLMGLVQGLDAEAVLTAAVAVGACNVEAADAVSGVPGWGQVQRRIAAGWARLPTRLALRSWGWEVDRGLWFGPGDRGGTLA